MSPAAPIQASAPGKLLLLGEYAVLYGAPALVAAVDRRARVTLTPSEDGAWRFSSAQLQLQNYLLDHNGATPASAPAETRAALGLFTAVMQTVGADAPQTVTIDSGDFFHGREKLGLGSSAAVAVALTGALAAAQRLNLTKPELFKLAARAHRRFQGGVGSNADIAAAVFGGALLHHSERAPAPVALPKALQILPVFTGTGASTSALIGEIEEFRKYSPDQFAGQIGAMTAIAERGARALGAGNAQQFIGAAGDYYSAMEALGQAADVGIISPAHQHLRQIAADCGAGYKPSGAGGGDIGCLFYSSEQDTARLTSTLKKAGFTPLPLALDAPGLRVM